MPSYEEPQLVQGRKRKRGSTHGRASPKVPDLQSVQPAPPCQQTECEIDVTGLRNDILTFSQGFQERLYMLFESSVNSYIPFFSSKELSTIKKQDDSITVLLHAAVLSVGLIHADVQDAEVQIEHSLASRRMRLHASLKDLVDAYDATSLVDRRYIALLLLLSELERAVGYIGSANMCLREASRIVATSEQGPEELAYDRICQFLYRQWNARGDTTQLSVSGMSMQNSVFAAHLALLQQGDDVGAVQRWLNDLPTSLRWSSKNAKMGRAHYMMHMQHRALIAGADTARIPELIGAVDEYERRFGITQAPLIVAKHVDVAARGLLEAAQADSQERGSHATRQKVNRLIELLEIMSVRFPVASKMVDSLKKTMRNKLWEESPVFDAFDEAPAPLLSIDYGNLDFANIQSSSFENMDQFAHLWAGVDTSQAFDHDARSPSTSSRATQEELIERISDPVFGGYIDEVGFIRGQSADAAKRRRHSNESQENDVSNETWRGNDVAEQFRAFLGHDIGIRGPEAFDADVVHDIGGSIWGDQMHFPQMVPMMAHQ